MLDINEFKDKLVKRFELAPETVRAPRPLRVFAEPPAEKFRAVLEFAVKEIGFDHVVTITGMDHKDTLGAIYHLAHPDGTLFNLHLKVSRDNPVIQTVTDLFPGSANYERELVDLLGFKVEGVPPGKRYPLPDDWPDGQHPLRKDWKPSTPTPA